jgi:hypothetical protein
LLVGRFTVCGSFDPVSSATSQKTTQMDGGCTNEKAVAQR